MWAKVEYDFTTKCNVFFFNKAISLQAEKTDSKKYLKKYIFVSTCLNLVL